MASDPAAALPQSHAAILRDAVYTLIAELGIMRTMRIVPTFQWQPEQETACGIYLRNETASPDGDTNAGEPHFRTTAVIGVSVLVKVEDPALLATATDIYVDPIQRAILTNPDFISMSEGVEGYSRVSSFPPNGSSYMSETRLEMTFSYQERWEPNVPYDYLRTIMKTLPLGNADAPVIATVIDQAQG